MPYVLKPNKLFAKNPNGTGYLPQNVITDRATADMVSEIEAAGTSQKNAVNEAGDAKLNSIETAGENHLEAINSAGTTQTNAVNTAGTTQVNAVNDAGATQVNAVNAAGTTQTDAIDSKSAEIDQKIANADSIIDRIDSAESLISELHTLIDLVHPVGSVYISLDSTDPGQLFGGTWAQIKGRFLLGTGTPDDNSNSFYGTDLTYDGTNKYNETTPGSTGGESRHTLSENELPAHTHPAATGGDWGMPEMKNVANKSGIWPAPLGTGGHLAFGAESDGTTYMSIQATTGSRGGNVAHNNLPPYMAVNMWRRTA